jgi:hypothetical protein
MSSASKDFGNDENTVRVLVGFGDCNLPRKNFMDLIGFKNSCSCTDTMNRTL